MSENPEPPPVQQDFSQPPGPTSYAPPTSDSPMSKMIPTANPPALIAYYLAIFGLVPGFCLVLSPAAVVLGIVGLKKIQANPELPGKVHAMIGIILGGIVTVICAVVGVMAINASLASRGG